jgi:glycosyltransferase involved in cell wall biosynthesis
MEAARVLFVAPSAYPLGGVQSWLDYLLPGLKARGWQPVLGLVAGHLHDVQRYVQEHPGHDVVSIASPTGSREGRVRAVVDAIRQVRPQLAVCVNICDCYAAIERLRAEREEAPHVVMADHSLEPDFLLDARAWRHVLDGFVGTNRLTVRLACEYAGLEPARVHYAPYGVPLAPDAANRAVRADDPLRIGYSGRLEQPQKRVQDIPAILAELERAGIAYRLRIAGDGPYKAELAAQLQARVERGAVEFLGRVDPAALAEQLYEWASVLLVTSAWETGPIVIWEAMAQHLAVVSSRYIGCGLEGGLRDGDNCLLYPAGDATSAAAQLARIADPALRRTLAGRAHDLVRTRYSREHSVAAWDECLRAVTRVAARSHAGAARAFTPDGRLDKWLGPRRGENVRRLFGRSHAHAEPGSEWPHTDHRLGPAEQEAFWAMAGEADAA